MRKVDAAKRSSDGGLQKRAAGGNAGGIAGRKGRATRISKVFSVMVAMLLVVLLVPGVAMGRGLLGGLLDGLTGGGQAASESSNTAGSTAASTSAGAIVGSTAASTSAGAAAGYGGAASTVGSSNPGDLSGSSAATSTSGEAGSAFASGVTAKSSVNDYTWDELSAIGEEIAATDSEESAIEVAKKYNLCTPEGKLDGTQTKSVTLSDGTQTSVQIAGFYHDDASTGYGKAGITFIFTDAVAQEPMFYNAGTYGWSLSDIRSWLASNFRDELPDDLIAKLVMVDKVSNDISTGIVSPVTTQDELWLFSSTELGGTIAWWSGNQSTYNDMLNVEGTEYQLFSDCGVSNNDSCAILSKTYGGSPAWWWTRSANPSDTATYDGVYSDGYLNCSDDMSVNNCVVPGFCIGSAPAPLDKYSWDELASISDEIAASGSEEAAIEIAKGYGLCTAEGTLDGTQSKKVVLSNGIEAEVQIAGFYHDDKSDGSGKAGITFVFKDAVSEYVMNSTGDSSGGWKSSEMRSWLSSSFMAMLPEELQTDIVKVDKYTNNTGQTQDPSSVTKSSDAVWLCSITELIGASDDSVMDIEGSQYQLFSDSGVSSINDNAILAKVFLPITSDSLKWNKGNICDWWSRSACSWQANRFCFIPQFGQGIGYESASYSAGVVPGFCIGTNGSASGSSAAIAFTASVEVKSSLNDYSWSDLSAIATEIAVSGSEDAALQVAQKYNLVGSDGKLDGTQTKSFRLKDGTPAEAQIAGFYHDDASDGYGKTGITFIFKDAVTNSVMNSYDGSNNGGWKSSDVRSWLSSDFMALLPDDVVPNIVTVDKYSNNVGDSADVASVTVTQDAVWLYSAAELCGNLDLNDDSLNSVINSEGSQYQLFADCAVSGAGSNAILSKIYQGNASEWWLRSLVPETDDAFYDISTDGNIDNTDSASQMSGVVPGFCLGSISMAEQLSGASATGSLSPKSSVNDYTWDELSAISNEISASGSADAALQVAEKYNLCSSDGRLDGTQTKSVTLSDGTQAEVQIAGFYHDDKSDGSGKAGITFIFKDAVAEHEMNQSDTSSGGWEASEMRSWLSSGFMSMLPSDLAKDIVTVDKLSNNTGETEDTSSVTATHDAVWLFSSTELCGSISWYGDSHDGVLNAEGAEYQLFSDNDVSSADGNAILTKNYQGEACLWWARSAGPGFSDYFHGVGSVGNPGGGASVTYAGGVVPGFCI